MASSSKDYLGLDRLVSLVLAIIPITSWILGIVVRVKEGHLIAAIIRAFLGFNIIWILDLVCMILGGKIFRLL